MFPLILEEHLYWIFTLPKDVKTKQNNLNIKKNKFNCSLFTDYWEENCHAVASLLLKRWKQLTENLVCEISLENVWVTSRGISRVREKPDQTPGPSGKGSRAGEYNAFYPEIVFHHQYIYKIVYLAIY